MADPSRPLHHHDAENLADEDLRREARGYLARNAHLQLIAELLHRLRALGMSWWSAEACRGQWSALQRMRWYAQRPDLRQQITTSLTGLPPNTARRKGPEFQADLIDAVIHDGDLTVERFEASFDPSDLVVYGPAFEFWGRFRDVMPWEDDSPNHQRLMSWLIKALLADKSSIEGLTRRPILTPWDVRSAIDTRVWQSRLPLEVRVAIDEARLRHERARPREPFQARHELSIAVPEILAANIPLAELSTLLVVAERNMGVEAQGDVAVPGDLLDAQPSNATSSIPAPMSLRVRMSA